MLKPSINGNANHINVDDIFAEGRFSLSLRVFMQRFPNGRVFFLPQKCVTESSGKGLDL